MPFKSEKQRKKVMSELNPSFGKRTGKDIDDEINEFDFRENEIKPKVNIHYIGNIMENTKKMIENSFNRIDKNVRGMVKDVFIYEKEGHETSIGDYKFKTGGVWKEKSNSIEIYNANDLNNYKNVDFLLSHEIAHSLWDKLNNDVRDETESKIFNKIDRLIGATKFINDKWKKHRNINMELKKELKNEKNLNARELIQQKININDTEWFSGNNSVENLVYKYAKENGIMFKRVLIDNFKLASDIERGVSDYSKRYFTLDLNDNYYGNRYTENFAESVLLWSSSEVSESAKILYPKTYKSYIDLVSSLYIGSSTDLKLNPKKLNRG